MPERKIEVVWIIEIQVRHVIGGALLAWPIVHSMSVPPPHLRNTSGSSISQRLGYFLAGLAIGLVMLGFLMSSRQRAAQQAAAEQEAAERRAEIEARDAADRVDETDAP